MGKEDFNGEMEKSTTGNGSKDRNTAVACGKGTTATSI